MQQKKKGRSLAVCLTLCFTLLCGGTFASHAVTPVCGGKHFWCRAYDVGYESKVITHNHDGYFCAKEYRQDRVLMRCPCGAEEVQNYGGEYIVHHIDYSLKLWF